MTLWCLLPQSAQRCKTAVVRSISPAANCKQPRRLKALGRAPAISAAIIPNRLEQPKPGSFVYAHLNHWKKLLPVAAAIGCLGVAPIGARAQSAARSAGYLYLSPVPAAPYVSDQTRYVL